MQWDATQTLQTEKSARRGSLPRVWVWTCPFPCRGTYICWYYSIAKRPTRCTMKDKGPKRRCSAHSLCGIKGRTFSLFFADWYIPGTIHRVYRLPQVPRLRCTRLFGPTARIQPQQGRPHHESVAESLAIPRERRAHP